MGYRWVVFDKLFETHRIPYRNLNYIERVFIGNQYSMTNIIKFCKK